jgi:2-polyprenyl-3-methyl-5-hydroxy-6-metoxy-1,4-benzoquinol methylase
MTNSYNQGTAYDAIADGFANMRTEFYKEQEYLDALIGYLPKPSGSQPLHILDIGCGSGVPIAAYFLEKGFSVTGIDGSQALLEIAKTKVPAMRGLLGDVRTIALQETFDAIVEWWCLFHVPAVDHEHMIARFATWLKPGGILEFTSGDAAYEAKNSEMLNQELVFYSLEPKDYEAYLEQYGFDLLVKEYDQEQHLVWIARKR